jgi:hypothetical protein
VDIQTAQYGHRRHHPKTEIGVGRLALLLTPFKNGGITPENGLNAEKRGAAKIFAGISTGISIFELAETVHWRGF